MTTYTYLRSQSSNYGPIRMPSISLKWFLEHWRHSRIQTQDPQRNHPMWVYGARYTFYLWAIKSSLTIQQSSPACWHESTKVLKYHFHLIPGLFWLWPVQSFCRWTRWFGNICWLISRSVRLTSSRKKENTQDSLKRWKNVGILTCWWNPCDFVFLICEQRYRILLNMLSNTLKSPTRENN